MVLVRCIPGAAATVILTMPDPANKKGRVVMILPQPEKDELTVSMSDIQCKYAGFPFNLLHA